LFENDIRSGAAFYYIFFLQRKMPVITVTSFFDHIQTTIDIGPMVEGPRR
jgi:hypothetical protein